MITKRDFLKKLAVAAAGFTILPPATTYERIWKAAPKLAIDPAFQSSEYTIVWLYSVDGFNKIMRDVPPLEVRIPKQKRFVYCVPQSLWIQANP